MSGIFQSTTIPILEQAVNFAQARHTALAGNIANVDTPGYVARDLSVEDFQSRLKQAIAERRQGPVVRSPGELAAAPGTDLAKVSQNPKSILFHDQSQVGLEHQVSEMLKNRMQHNLALSVMVSQFRLLQAAISERA